MNDTNDLWKRCADTLREQVSDATWRTWLTGLVPQAFDGDLLVLTAPSTLVRDRIENRFLGLIAAAVSESWPPSRSRSAWTWPMPVADPVPLTSLLDDERSSPDSPSPTEPAGTPPGRSTGRRRASASDERDAGGLDVRYGFDSFVIGSSNRFAHAAALAVAEMPARSYNPLFIHGGAGLGKTHLLHAIGNYVRENFAGRHVRYVSTETFMNEFVDAIRNNTTAAFKRHYRECDVLLIDDVQFMEGKEVPPGGVLPHLQPPLRGLQAGRPDLGPAAEIHRHPGGPPPEPLPLRADHRRPAPRARDPPGHLAEEARARAPPDVPDDVLEFIAANVKGNIRELEGALIRVTAPSPASTTSPSPVTWPNTSCPTSSWPASPAASPRP